MRFLAVALALLAAPASAADLVGQYQAFIGQDDLYNSNGKRLTEPWQILRQDRANVHKFGISQPGDQTDPFFGSVDNRAAMEQMVMHGTIEPSARRALLRGGVMVLVKILWPSRSRRLHLGDRGSLTTRYGCRLSRRRGRSLWPVGL